MLDGAGLPFGYIMLPKFFRFAARSYRSFLETKRQFQNRLFRAPSRRDRHCTSLLEGSKMSESPITPASEPTPVTERTPASEPMPVSEPTPASEPTVPPRDDSPRTKHSCWGPFDPNEPQARIVPVYSVSLHLCGSSQPEFCVRRSRANADVVPDGQVVDESATKDASPFLPVAVRDRLPQAHTRASSEDTESPVPITVLDPVLSDTFGADPKEPVGSHDPSPTANLPTEANATDAFGVDITEASTEAALAIEIDNSTGFAGAEPEQPVAVASSARVPSTIPVVQDPAATSNGSPLVQETSQAGDCATDDSVANDSTMSVNSQSAAQVDEATSPSDSMLLFPIPTERAVSLADDNASSEASIDMSSTSPISSTISHTDDNTILESGADNSNTLDSCASNAPVENTTSSQGVLQDLPAPAPQQQGIPASTVPIPIVSAPQQSSIPASTAPIPIATITVPTPIAPAPQQAGIPANTVPTAPLSHHPRAGENEEADHPYSEFAKLQIHDDGNKESISRSPKFVIGNAPPALNPSLNCPEIPLSSPINSTRRPPTLFAPAVDMPLTMLPRFLFSRKSLEKPFQASLEKPFKASKRIGHRSDLYSSRPLNKSSMPLATPGVPRFELSLTTLPRLFFGPKDRVDPILVPTAPASDAAFVETQELAPQLADPTGLAAAFSQLCLGRKKKSSISRASPGFENSGAETARATSPVAGAETEQPDSNTASRFTCAPNDLVESHWMSSSPSSAPATSMLSTAPEEPMVDAEDRPLSPVSTAIPVEDQEMSDSTAMAHEEAAEPEEEAMGDASAQLISQPMVITGKHELKEETPDVDMVEMPVEPARTLTNVLPVPSVPRSWEVDMVDTPERLQDPALAVPSTAPGMPKGLTKVQQKPSEKAATRADNLRSSSGNGSPHVDLVANAIYQTSFPRGHEPIATSSMGNLCGWAAVVNTMAAMKDTILPPDIAPPTMESLPSLLNHPRWIQRHQERQLPIAQNNFSRDELSGLLGLWGSLEGRNLKLQVGEILRDVGCFIAYVEGFNVTTVWVTLKSSTREDNIHGPNSKRACGHFEGVKPKSLHESSPNAGQSTSPPSAEIIQKPISGASSTKSCLPGNASMDPTDCAFKLAFPHGPRGINTSTEGQLCGLRAIIGTMQHMHKGIKRPTLIGLQDIVASDAWAQRASTLHRIDSSTGEFIGALLPGGAPRQSDFSNEELSEIFLMWADIYAPTVPFQLGVDGQERRRYLGRRKNMEQVVRVWIACEPRQVYPEHRSYRGRYVGLKARGPEAGKSRQEVPEKQRTGQEKDGNVGTDAASQPSHVKPTSPGSAKTAVFPAGSQSGQTQAGKGRGKKRQAEQDVTDEAKPLPTHEANEGKDPASGLSDERQKRQRTGDVTEEGTGEATKTGGEKGDQQGRGIDGAIDPLLLSEKEKEHFASIIAKANSQTPRQSQTHEGRRPPSEKTPEQRIRGAVEAAKIRAKYGVSTPGQKSKLDMMIGSATNSIVNNTPSTMQQRPSSRPSPAYGPLPASGTTARGPAPVRSRQGDNTPSYPDPSSAFRPIGPYPRAAVNAAGPSSQSPADFLSALGASVPGTSQPTSPSTDASYGQVTGNHSSPSMPPSGGDPSRYDGEIDDDPDYDAAVQAEFDATCEKFEDGKLTDQGKPMLKPKSRTKK